MTKTRYAVAVAVLTSAMALAQGTAPDRVTFNGRLTDTAGQPVTGTHALVFSLYDVASGGTSLWSETYASTSFTADGLAFVELGTNTPLTTSILDGRKLYLEISVDGTAMSPRVGIVSVPYAIRATEAARLGTLTPADVQRRVTGTCAAGNAIRTIDATGNVVCEAVGGGGGSYTAAANGGLSLTGTAFSLLNTCSSGQVLKAGATAGTWACAADSDTTYTAAANGGLAVNGTALSLVTCAANQILKSNGTTWSCQADSGGAGTVTSVSGTAPISVATGTTTPVISMTQASGSAPGWLSAADWTTFNSKWSTGGSNMIDWTPVTAKWTLIGGTAATITLNTTDVLEGSSSFEFFVPSGTTGAGYVYGDLIPVDSRQAHVGRVSAKYVSGGGNFYAGIRAYNAAGGNLGERWFIANNVDLSLSAAWYPFGGTIQAEGGATNQFPAGTRFVRPIIYLSNGNIGGTRVDAFTFDTTTRVPWRRNGMGNDGTCDVSATCGPSALAARALTLRKVDTSSTIRVQYTDNMRSWAGDGTARACRWSIYFDGAPCPSGNISGVVYASSPADLHQVRTISGYCSGLAPGTHTVQVYVSNHTGYQARCYTGWPGDAMFNLEAEEVY